MTVHHSIETFSYRLSFALVETLELHSDHLLGHKLYGATLVSTTDDLLPWFAVLDDSDTVGMEPHRRWAPDDFCTALNNPLLAEVCGLTHDLRHRWSGTNEEWRRISLLALSDALGSRPVRHALHSMGADPILYIFDDRGAGIEATTFVALNAGRESEPFYRQASRFLL